MPKEDMDYLLEICSKIQVLQASSDDSDSGQSIVSRRSRRYNQSMSDYMSPKQIISSEAHSEVINHTPSLHDIERALD